MKISSRYIEKDGWRLVETPVVVWSECDECCTQTVELSNKVQVADAVLKQLKTLADICDKADLSFEALCREAEVPTKWYALIGPGNGPASFQCFSEEEVSRAQALADEKGLGKWVEVDRE